MTGKGHHRRLCAKATQQQVIEEVMQDLQKLESDLWEAADQLRANSRLTAGEYSMPVLGLIFLRQATNRFYQVKAQIEATLPSRGGVKRPLTPDDFRGQAALHLPAHARYETLVNLPDGADIGAALVKAMTDIEAQSVMLQGALPKEYTRFDPALLRQLLRIFNRDALRTATGDVFGRIYEYFLNEFAKTGAQEGGEFFTPPSLVRMIVAVIEPDHGNLLDCAIGSAGMFVQTGYFLEQLGKDPSRTVVFFGQEKSDLTIRLARMNLAVHGLEGTIYEGNTYYDLLEALIGACNYVMANPPFNVDMVDPERIKNDSRLPFGIPGVSQKSGAVSNANYLWIQYFYSYLNATGRAGFVMASSATDAGHGEKRIRQELIKTGHVDAIIAIGTNFFYTRSLPCTLWFFDKAKPAARQETVLMIDARSIYRVVTRKVRDFSDEQLQNLTAITWLYRGQHARFLGLVGDYLAHTHELVTALHSLDGPLHRLDAPLDDLAQRLQTYADRLAEELAQPPSAEKAITGNGMTPDDVAALRDLLVEQQIALATLRSDRAAVQADLGAYLAWVAGLGEAAHGDNATQHAMHDRFAPLADRLRHLQKHVTEAYKRTDHALAHAEKALGARRHSDWDNAAVRAAVEVLTAGRDATVEMIRACLHSFAQVTWLQSRFPDATFVAVPGLCAAVTRATIDAHDSSLTPGRYVGVAAPDLADDGEFEERIGAIHGELASLNEEANVLAATIQGNFQELGV